MRVDDLPRGLCSAILILRKSGKVRVRGEILIKGDVKRLVVQQSPKKTYAPGTRVSWYRKEANAVFKPLNIIDS